MQVPLFSDRLYIFLFSLLGLVYIPGLFLPLIDNDSAHHAVIGLRMYLTGDYVNLIDHRGDYIDKPHLLFWLSALSYDIFGVTSFAYRIPSFLFTILGTYSIFRLGKALYNSEVGKLAALLAASSFCYMLANSDVRMDAILTATIAFSMWQLVAFVQQPHWKNIVLAATGLAIGFATKGHVGLVTPAVGIFLYIVYQRKWQILLSPYWLLLIILFAILISPIVYCFYLQFDRYPEKISQGMKGVSGVKYILWDHSFHRIGGHERFGTMAKQDKFYLLHTFLWTFAPWSILMGWAILNRTRFILSRKYELMTIGAFWLLALLINFSYFKLPHYLPILAPMTGIILSNFLLEKWKENRYQKVFYLVMLICALLIVFLAVILNTWAFPMNSWWKYIPATILLSFIFYALLTRIRDRLQKAILLGVFSMSFLFLLLYINFYPQLMKYQGGQELARLSKGTVDPERVYFWKNTFSSSYNYYSSSYRKVFHDSLLGSNQPYWIIYDKSLQSAIDSAGLSYKQLYTVQDYEVSRMRLPFINPETRQLQLSEMIMIRVN